MMFLASSLSFLLNHSISFLFPVSFSTLSTTHRHWATSNILLYSSLSRTQLFKTRKYQTRSMMYEKFSFKILILLLSIAIIKANPHHDGREMKKVLIKRQDTAAGGNTAITPPTVITPIPVQNTPTSPTTIPVNTPGTPTTTPNSNSPTTTPPFTTAITPPVTTPQSNNQGGGGGGGNTSPTTAPSGGGGGNGNTSPQSSTPAQSIPPTSLTSSRSSPSSSIPTSVPSSSSTTIIVAVTTVLITLDNGSVSSSASSSTSTAVITAAAGSSGNDPSTKTSGGNGKTWAIVGGVVGGLIILAALVFVTYRLTNKRFNSLDDLNLDELKWPELKADNPAASSLNPSATRRTGGSGFDMGDEIDEEGEGGVGGVGIGEGSDGLNGSHEGRSVDGATSGSVVSGRSMSTNPLMGLSGSGAEHYRDDPYHSSSQPYPPSPNAYTSNSPIPYQSQPPSPNAYTGGAHFSNPNANLYSNPVGAEIYQANHNTYPTFHQENYSVQDRRVSGYGYE